MFFIRFASSSFDLKGFYCSFKKKTVRLSVGSVFGWLARAVENDRDIKLKNASLCRSVLQRDE